MLHLFLQTITTKYNQSQPNTPTLVSWEVVFSSVNTTNYNYTQINGVFTLFYTYFYNLFLIISYICECKYNVLHLYTNNWCIYTMLHLFLQSITTKYNQSQPNTPTLVSWVIIPLHTCIFTFISY